MAQDDDFVPLLVFGAIGYYLWRNWATLAPMFGTTTTTISSSPAIGTTYPAMSQWVNPPVQYAGTQGQIVGTPNPSSGGVPAGLNPGASSSVFSNPSWNPQAAQQQQQGQYDAATLAALDAASSKGSYVMNAPYTGSSLPNAPVDPVLSPQSLWYLQNCTYITGSPIQPPPPGCA